MPKIHLIEGPVGAGKTTFANVLSADLKSPPLILDQWMVTLFQKDRPEKDFMPCYAERKSRCINQIWILAQSLLATGHDAILELGLVQANARKAFYARIETLHLPYTVHVLDAPTETRHARVQSRNTTRGATFAMHVSDEIFALANQFWQPPTPAECAHRDIRFYPQSTSAPS